MRLRSLNTADWTFVPGFDPARTTEPLEGTSVELPHSAVELPLSYFDETAYQQPFTYQINLPWEDRFEGQEVALQFDGAMADAEVWVNGEKIAAHRDGYTPFEARLTPHLSKEGTRVTVKIDGSENPEIPPFGGRIDYLTYAGIYRDVWLKVVPKVAIQRVAIRTPDALAEAKSLRATVHLSAPDAAPEGTLTARLVDAEGRTLAEAETPVTGETAEIAMEGLTGITLWSCETPALYTLELSLGEDSLSTRFGFRTVEFTPHGFELNGKPLKLTGLNRHQAFPYSGYAQGRKSQERDAELLQELGCNLARTSHYPQSSYFLDRCDEIGLLVFEEIPGWQHIGGEGWKAESVENVRRMIRRDFNHPSIIIWGVRINESLDDHDFYTATNAAAHEEDDTRQTGGVRFRAESEFLEDVYTMNDFILGDFENPMSNRPRTALRPVPETTGLKEPVPYIVTEYNGHMFPTKSGDPEQRQVEHVTRHLDVLNAMHGDPQISGCIGWCFYDYNTHKDFGSGDRICHHGVATMWREPKFAAHAYASQQDPETRVVMEPVTYWTRGDRNIGDFLPLMVLTNCDEVEFRYGSLSKRVGPDHARYPHLPHPPVIIDHRHFTPEELGRWGAAWSEGEVIGYRGGAEVARRRFAADPLPTTLEVAPDAAVLEAEARDEVRVIVRALDQQGNRLPFLNDVARFEVSGPAQIIGPDWAAFEGGTTGLWLRATGGTGPVTLTVQSQRFAPVTVEVQAQ
ncbi:glycoside hydrolase family 2 TIM barrel-domain containing protein [Pseudoroseicyclus aestuarii]|uniref:Beta-galactosidase n=1 Tax=Pseudoroseicyclus aestuarii TaxID=1795041 RepID=A0A318SP43_9RHOB|nr:glycoside hydrolase family 2 TIM barrel-domain containing protein [Pseudoroseicyclus aestuarii]PYE83650.1 beta-galactosidase [Pseudoroseicyclus aestuarii]